MLANTSDISTSLTSLESGILVLMPIWAYHLSAAYLILITVLGLILNGCFLWFILRDPKVLSHILLCNPVSRITSFFTIYLEIEISFALFPIEFGSFRWIHYDHWV